MINQMTLRFCFYCFVFYLLFFIFMFLLWLIQARNTIPRLQRIVQAEKEEKNTLKHHLEFHLIYIGLGRETDEKWGAEKLFYDTSRKTILQLDPLKVFITYIFVSLWKQPLAYSFHFTGRNTSHENYFVF